LELFTSSYNIVQPCRMKQWLFKLLFLQVFNRQYQHILCSKIDLLVNRQDKACCEFEYRSGRGVKHYVIKFVSYLRQVVGFLRVLRSPLPQKIKTDRHDITETLLKVALNSIKQTNKQTLKIDWVPC
jgi:hypothetical protein